MLNDKRQTPKKSKKPNKGEREGERGVMNVAPAGRRRPGIPIGRSPALEALERQERATRQSATGKRQTVPPVPRATRQTNRAELPSQHDLSSPAVRRKSLPPTNGVGSRFSRSGLSRAMEPPQSPRSGAVNVYAKVEPHTTQRRDLTVNWRLRRSGASAPPSTPIEVINAEEQKKLEALEMSLPRVPGKIDTWLLVVVLALLCTGLVMIYSASSFVAARSYGDVSYYFVRQLLAGLLGVVAMLVTMRIDYRQWRRFSLTGMAIILPLLVLVLLVGTSAYGASRWLNIGPFFSFQPSELAKLVLALYIADWLARKGDQVGTFLYGLAPFVILVGVILGLVLLENDMGTAIIIAGLAVAMFFTAGANIVQFLLAMACGGLVFLTQAFKGYRFYRMMGFLDPFKDVTGMNLQLYQSLLGLGSGGWIGVGLGASRQKAGWLPLPYIDSIFAVIGEEVGFIGSALVILLFLFLAFRGFRLARRTQDIYGALLATGITTWLVLQAIVNIGATSASIPYTGVPLPFISYGGSALVVSMAAVGVLLNISRYIQEPDAPALSKRNITQTIKKNA